MTARKPRPLSYVEQLQLDAVADEMEDTRRQLREIAAGLPRMPHLRRVVAFVERVKADNTRLYGALAQVRRDGEAQAARLAEQDQRLAAQHRALDDLQSQLDQLRGHPHTAARCPHCLAGRHDLCTGPPTCYCPVRASEWPAPAAP
jgi:hypothetical protein